ncbi:iron-siderophore ABC transporter substrate-binding protein [Brevibacterium aurantiacum]|uniref:ABC transporter substrate-binding protein n=1 Tax=Brevibacterium aurantiacum TaxID=273384 RepID=A0A2H1JD81_BREAU|nr:iron-siderophore ABC transporter substrate-binding protein [Brevibacterium aurantiacum]PCC19688.1 ABC transporter substrate-binding protein [Brevibacterium aurantiacum]RCS92596.1 iron-siderophore ABC transporter substrate-binding protein [Brevibacterium aurantiacum]SMX85419.1 iron complex transport system substrate-binding protein [Brevibacterium aurantiacum]SMX86419.1 iron complex transport system substrate-binding protein [Brevibacterium aurantiacum]
MRRILAPVLASVLLLAACGGGGGEEEAASGISIDTKFGSVEVPKDPKKVVALGWGDAETALALGVQPIGASDWVEFGGKGVGPWAEDLYDQAPEIIDTMEPDFEKIAALEPDLILDTKSSGEQERYDRLSEIAPTVGAPEGGDNYLTTMDQQVNLVSQALGKEDEGKKVLGELDKKYEAARKAHPEFDGKSVSVAAKTSEGWGAYVEGSERVQFMEQLGFKQSEKVAALKPEGFTATVSEEKLDDLDADLLVAFPIYIPDTEVTKDAAFKRIPAVEDGRSLVLTEDLNDVRQAFSLNSVLSASFAAEKMPDLVADKVK